MKTEYYIYLKQRRFNLFNWIKEKIKYGNYDKYQIFFSEKETINKNNLCIGVCTNYDGISPIINEQLNTCRNKCIDLIINGKPEKLEYIE